MATEITAKVAICDCRSTQLKKTHMTNLIVIPARGGSKGIPRKSIRPLAGKPLISYTIQAALKIPNSRVIVSTDDDEIGLLAERFGATVIFRPSELGDDHVTLDPVIVNAAIQAERHFSEQYNLVITVQPTSPLLEPVDITNAISLFSDPSIDTVLSVVDDRHLRWTVKDNIPVPEYVSRVNRQQLPPTFRETGAIIACRRQQLNKGSRIGQNVKLLEVPVHRSFDIDSIADLFLCESLLTRKKIVFTVVGYPAVGLGHAYRTIMLAHELVRHEVHFVCCDDSMLAAEHIRSFNYPVSVVTQSELISHLALLQPDLVINDILDTDAEYILKVKELGCKVVNFEDLGSGHPHAHLVFNALYPSHSGANNVRSGPAYFCLRDEFLYTPHREVRPHIQNILVTFGGVDEGNLTARVISNIAPWCKAHETAIDIVLGPGYIHDDDLEQILAQHPGLLYTITRVTKRISEYMARADLAITSGGRTVLELASMEVPTIVICQNERETTHTFASSEHGIANLGYRLNLSDTTLRERFIEIANNATLRAQMREKAKRLDLKQGKRRVIGEILQLIS